MIDEKKILVRKMYKNKIFFSIFMSFLLDKLHRGGGLNLFTDFFYSLVNFFFQFLLQGFCVDFFK